MKDSNTRDERKGQHQGGRGNHKKRHLYSDRSRADDENRRFKQGGGQRPNQANNHNRPAGSNRPTRYERTSNIGRSANNDRPEELREDRLEGRNPVREALKAGRTIEKAWVLKPASGSYDRPLYELITDIRKQGGVINEVNADTMSRISQTFSHQGIIVQTAAHTYVELNELLTMAGESGEPPFFLVLDKIQDAYNLGSILRVADACGAHGVIFPKRRSVGLSALVAKASAGAIEHVPCCRVNNLAQALGTMKKAGIWIAGTDAAGQDVYTESDLSGPLAVVIGSEGQGLSPATAGHCDFLLSIPMRGAANSLNAAVAGGVIAFEIARQRRLKNDE